MRYAVCIPVGPGAADARRLRTLVTSLFRHERAVSLLVIADASGDDAATRLRELVPPTCQGVRLDCAAAAAGACGPLTTRLMGLRYLSDREDVDVCVQLGLGCLVAGPFAAGLTDTFDANPGVGLAGRFTGPTGGHVCGDRIVQWKAPIARWLGRRRFGGHDPRRLARLARGETAGPHCLGAAYALPRTVIAALETAGLLAREWPADADEGRLLSAMVLSAGYALADRSRAGEAFGVGSADPGDLPRTPGGAGHAVVGAVMSGDQELEREVVGHVGDVGANALAA